MQLKAMMHLNVLKIVKLQKQEILQKIVQLRVDFSNVASGETQFFSTKYHTGICNVRARHFYFNFDLYSVIQKIIFTKVFFP
jgi:hypothetical protein